MPAAITNRDEIAQAIIERIAAGEFLTDICRDPGMPARQTFWEWVDRDEELATRCARARARAATEDERAVAELARRVVAGEIEPDAARTAANMHTWLAKVRNPKVYGDKLDVEHKGRITVVPVLNVTIAGPAPRIVEGEAEPDGE